MFNHVTSFQTSFRLNFHVILFQIAIGTDDVYKSAEVINLVTQELGGKITRQPGSIPGLNTKITSFLDPDGWKTVSVWLSHCFSALLQDM